ncbi:hypothetical protein T484DRAFT_1758009, partial [Baffinella frigidus]
LSYLLLAQRTPPLDPPRVATCAASTGAGLSWTISVIYAQIFVTGLGEPPSNAVRRMATLMDSPPQKDWWAGQEDSALARDFLVEYEPDEVNVSADAVLRGYGSDSVKQGRTDPSSGVIFGQIWKCNFRLFNQ